MGSRRVSRKRLYNVEKAGISVDLESGAGAAPMIKSATQHRQGQEIITEIAIDLAPSSGGPIASGNGDGKASGVAAKAAQITQLTRAKYGVITEIRTVVVEAPSISSSGVAVNITLGEYGQNTNAGATTGEAITGATDSNPTALATVGQDEVQDIDNAATFQNGASAEYLYLAANTTDNGDYDAGKILIYIHGFEVPADL